MAGPLIADTGGLLRAVARKPDGQPAWPDFAKTLSASSRVVVTDAVLIEVDYFLRDNRPAMRELIAELFNPATTLEYRNSTPDLISRAIQIDQKFADLDLGLVDCIIAATAERLRIYRVLTIDSRDFSAVRVGERFNVKLEIVP